MIYQYTLSAARNGKVRVQKILRRNSIVKKSMKFSVKSIFFDQRGKSKEIINRFSVDYHIFRNNKKVYF